MPDRDTHVIAGAGLAGAKAAEALPQEGFEGQISLVASRLRSCRTPRSRSTSWWGICPVPSAG